MAVKGREMTEIQGDAQVDIADGSIATIIIKPEKDSKVVLSIGKGCKVRSFVIQEKKASVEQINHVGEDSVIHTYSLWLSDGSGKLLNSLEGARSEAYDVQVFVEKGADRLHLDSVLRHAEKDTKGNILVKGIVRDNAAAKLDGMIKIEKSGGGAESFLSEHVMLLDPGAHATANPELEIENNDVSSRHAASVSQIDSEKIFYLMSRGLSREESRKMIIEGFLESAIADIPEGEMREELMKKTMAAI